MTDRDGRLGVATDRGELWARGLINATGTWEAPYVPHYPGAERFAGRQLHTRDYRTADEFRGQHVIVVGGGISAIQLLDEVSRVTMSWLTVRLESFRVGLWDSFLAHACSGVMAGWGAWALAIMASSFARAAFAQVCQAGRVVERPLT